MANIENDLLLLPGRKPFLSLISIVLLAFGGLVVGQIIGMGLVMILFDYGMLEVADGIATVTPEFKIPIFLIQGFTALFAFILAPYFYLRFLEKRSLGVLSPVALNNITLILLAAVIALVFIPVNFKFMEWNSALTLSDWMTEQEENLEKLTRLLTTMDSFGQFVLAMLVIAVIPAIGEELLFRGLIQNKLQLMLRNSHWAIWITAILFSAIHFQFYGFVPRMVLGALFGYLYVWSGNLWIPIIGHFINNGIQIVLLYIYQRQITELNIDEVETVPWGTFFLASLITVGLLYYFYRKSQGFTTTRWQPVFSTNQMHQAEIVKGVLLKNELDPIVINKKDSSYDNFGQVEVHVTSDQVIEALRIINKDIQFE